MRRDDVGLWAPALGVEGRVAVYGHHGRPLLAFPSQQGQRWDFEERGMLEGITALVDAGRVKVYCVDSFDSASWMRDDLPLEERARRHDGYHAWITEQVIAFVHADCGGYQEVIATGCSFGAYHAANLALRRADLVPLAICLSGVYDIAGLGFGEHGLAAYFNNPMASLANAEGDHLAWLRSRLSLVLVAGQGQWEDTTGALESTRHFAALLDGKGIRCELDLWGYDVPHDWPSWRRQLAHHLPRFC